MNDAVVMKVHKDFKTRMMATSQTLKSKGADVSMVKLTQIVDALFNGSPPIIIVKKPPKNGDGLFHL